VAQAPALKPNILFIMGDDIGWMQVDLYHRGLAGGRSTMGRPPKKSQALTSVRGSKK
jgi:arylsulfatase A-like enzyme